MKVSVCFLLFPFSFCSFVLSLYLLVFDYFFMQNKKYECIVIGVSAGGMSALQQFLPFLPSDFSLPIIIVQHLHPQQGNFHIEFYDSKCNLRVSEANEKTKIKAGNIYFAPANYHLLVEEDRTFSLSVDPKINYSRPSVDVLFESAIDVCREKVIGVVLTGANNDGAAALKLIKEIGGLTIVQNPNEAEVNAMPRSAIRAHKPDFILTLDEIKDFFLNLRN